MSDNPFGVHTSWPYLERKIETYCWKENIMTENDKTTYTDDFYFNTKAFFTFIQADKLNHILNWSRVELPVRGLIRYDRCQHKSIMRFLFPIRML